MTRVYKLDKMRENLKNTDRSENKSRVNELTRGRQTETHKTHVQVNKNTQKYYKKKK